MADPRPGAAGGESPTSPVTPLMYFEKAMDGLEKRLVSLIDSNDRRYLELFQASEKATATAMVASEKAINAAMVAAKEAVLAALAASERAVGKAEESQLRVNVGQNEFRQQLKDQASTFVTIAVHEGVDRRLQMLERNSVSKEVLDAVISQATASRNGLDARIQTLEKNNITVGEHDEVLKRLGILERGESGVAGKSGANERYIAIALSIAAAVIISLILKFIMK